MNGKRSKQMRRLAKILVDKPNFEGDYKPTNRMLKKSWNQLSHVERCKIGEDNPNKPKEN